MLDVATHGSLSVAWSVQDQRSVQRELTNLSPTLLLTPECDPDWGLFWTVIDRVHSGEGGTITVLVWRDPDGRPRPLSQGIVDAVRRKEGALDGAGQFLRNAEDKRRSRLAAERENTYSTIEGEHLPRMKAVSDGTLPPFWRPKRFGAS